LPALRQPVPQFTCLVKRSLSTEQQPDLRRAPHTPVLLHESLEGLKLEPNQTLLDMTFGAGGHSIAALKSTPNLKVLALDRDPVAHQFALDVAETFPGQVVPLLGKFSDLSMVLRENNVKPGEVDAILIDLGCSSMQFDDGLRGIKKKFFWQLS